VKRQQDTGSVAPGKMDGHRPKVISGEHRLWVLQRTRGGDFTLRGLEAELAKRWLKVDYRSVWELVHAEKLSFKKKAWWLAMRPSGRRAAAGAVHRISKLRRS
jgi:transposase